VKVRDCSAVFLLLRSSSHVRVLRSLHSFVSGLSFHSQHNKLSTTLYPSALLQLKVAPWERALPV
jgi:hypothetical protein